MSDTGESKPIGGWPYLFGGISVSHAALLGAFISRIEFRTDLEAFFSLTGFVVVLAVLVLCVSFSAHNKHPTRGGGYVATIVTTTIFSVALLSNSATLGAHASYEDPTKAFFVGMAAVTIASWVIFCEVIGFIVAVLQRAEDKKIARNEKPS